MSILSLGMGWFFFEAIARGHAEVVRYFLGLPGMSLERLQNGLCDAAFHGELEVLKILS